MERFYRFLILGLKKLIYFSVTSLNHLNCSSSVDLSVKVNGFDNEITHCLRLSSLCQSKFIFSDFMLTFAMSLMILLVLICSTKASEKSDMTKSWAARL